MTTPLREQLRREWFFLAMFMLLGLVIRLDIWRALGFGIDADEAVVGLMARDILLGRGVPIFYYGQPYMGSLEPLLGAVSFLVLGESNMALQLVPFLFSIMLIGLVHALGILVGGPWVGRGAALLIACGPQPLIVWSLKARGGFIELVCLATLALMLTVLWLRSPIRPPKMLAWIGFVLGVGWWVNNQIAFVMPPIAFAVLTGFAGSGLGWAAQAVRFAQNAFRGMVGFLIGSLPFWWYNLHPERFMESMKFLKSPAPEGAFLKHLAGFFENAVPMLLGARRFWQREDNFIAASQFVWIIYGVVFLWSAWFILRERWKEPRGPLRSLEVIMLSILSTITIFSASSFGWLTEAPRYLLPLYPMVAVMLAAALVVLTSRALVPSIVLFSCVVAINLISIYPGERALPGEPFVFGGDRVSRDHHDLYEWLAENNVQWIRTNYWIGYRVAFETGEATRFRVFQAPYQERITRYVEESPRDLHTMPLVVVPSEARLVAAGLDALGVRAKMIERSGYRIFFDFEPVTQPGDSIPCEQVTVTASVSQDNAYRAADCHVGTRWGSARPQAPGMEVTFELPAGTMLNALEYDLGSYRHDYPREFVIEFEDGAGKRETLLASRLAWEGARYLLEERSLLTFLFTPRVVHRVRMKQLGSDPIFDWSIPEVTFRGILP